MDPAALPSSPAPGAPAAAPVVGPLAVAVLTGTPIPIDEAVLGKRFQPGAWVLGAQDVGGTAVMIQAKWHDGRAWFHTDLSPSRTPRDFLRELRDLAQTFEVQLIYAYSVQLDAAAARLHPEWVARQGDGAILRRQIDGRDFPVLSLWTAYADFVMGQLRELVGCYGPVAGFWLDALEPVFSWDEAAVTAFRKAHQMEPTEAPPAFLWQFACQSCAAFVERAAAILRADGRAVRLAAGQFLNQSWVPPVVDWTIAPAAEADAAASIARWARGRSRPFHILLETRDSPHWGQHVLKGAGRLALEAAEVFAQGQQTMIGVRPLPTGRLFDAELALVQTLHRRLQPRAPYLSGAASVADIAILVTPEAEHQAYRRRVAEYWPTGSAPWSPGADDPLAVGFQHALDEQHLLFDLRSVEDRFEDYRLVLLPEQTLLAEPTLQRLKAYVSAGGCVLTEGHASLVQADGVKAGNFALADLFGVDFVGYSSDTDGHYINVVDRRLKDGLPEDYPIQVVGPAIVTRMGNCWRLAKLVVPVATTAPVQAWSGGRPPGELTQTGALVANRSGRGLWIYCSLPLGRHLACQAQTWWVSRLLANVIVTLMGEPTLRTDAPSAVRVRLARRPGEVILHLLNRLAGICAHTPPALTGCSVSLWAERLGPVSSAVVVPGESAVDLRSEGPWIRLRLPELDPIHTMVVLRP